MKFTGWLKERFPIDYEKFIEINERIFVKEPIPNHMKKWYYCSGAAPLVLFGIQVLTGILLTFYFIPSPEMAYESVRHISEEVRLGFWVRGLHRWGSNLMIIALLLHIIRVFFTHAYRKPRELNWVVGVVMFLLTLALSFTGYSLTYNQLSYWATTVGTNMIKAVPLVGESLLLFMRGGEEVTANTLTRFFTLHVGFLPPLLLAAIVIHILILRLHGMADIDGYKKGYYSFYPHHFFKIIILTLFIINVLSALTIILPPGLGEAANPAITPQHIKPEWYFFPTYRFLKLVPLNIGILGTALFLVGMVFWPFIEPLLSKNKKTRNKLAYWVGGVSLVITVGFSIWESIVL